MQMEITMRRREVIATTPLNTSCSSSVVITYIPIKFKQFWIESAWSSVVLQVFGAETTRVPRS